MPMLDNEDFVIFHSGNFVKDSVGKNKKFHGINEAKADLDNTPYSDDNEIVNTVGYRFLVLNEQLKGRQNER